MNSKHWIFYGLVILAITSLSAHAQVAYEVTLTIPPYDVNNSSMALIETNEDWELIDDEEITHFYVTPGDYTALGEIRITASGSEGNPRWLVYYDPENPDDMITHPVDMAVEKRAEFERLSIRGSYWIVDRLYGTATEGSKNPTFELLESNIIINRVLVENGGGGAGQVQIAGPEAVVQNSVIRNTQIIPNNDIHGMKISEGVDARIVNNEIYNFAGDGIQLGDKPESFKGTVIYNNDFYIDVSLYPEEVEEIPHENAIDIKQAGVPGNSQNLVLIKNNRFRNIAHSPGGTSPNVDQGTIDFSNKNDAKSHVLVEDNIFYDCKIPFNTKGGGQTSNFTIRRNLIYQATRYAIWVPGELGNHEFAYNTIIDVLDFEGDRNWLNSQCENLQIYGNLIVDGGTPDINEGNYVSDYNVFANTTETTSEGANSIDLGTIEEDEFEDYCFTFKALTDPTTLCIPNAQPLQSADFTYLTANQYFGSVQNSGIDDALYNQDWIGALYPASHTDFPTLEFQTLATLDTISGEVEVVINAQDANDDLSGIQLMLDGQNLGGLITVEPFSYTWSTTSSTDGLHTLKAMATDEAGHITYAQSIEIFVDNISDSAPSVVLDSPQEGTEIANTVTLSATASDPDGDLVGVQFMLSGNTLGYEKFSSPFELEWNTIAVSDGDYEIWAVARDYGGRVVSTNPISIKVNNSYPPLVSIINVEEDSVFVDSIELIAEASDKDDDIISIEFRADDEIIGEVEEAPYSILWDTKEIGNGAYDLVAIAEDADGNIATSRAISIQVENHVLQIPTNSTGDTLYPNPTSQYFKLDGFSEGSHYEILSSNGERVMKNQLGSRLQIDVSTIPDGIYIVRMTSPLGENQSFKLIKTNH